MIFPTAEPSNEMATTDAAPVMHLDCPSGLAGDMFLGACLDAGLPRAVLEEIPARLGLDQVNLSIEESTRGGLAGVRFSVLDSRLNADTPQSNAEDLNDGRTLESGHKDHRGLTEIRRRIEGSGLAPIVRERADAMFVRLAEVEAKMHRLPIEDIHFHELGAVDSMIDIVGAAAAMDYFSPARVTCGVVVTGDGTVQTAHGLLPVPAPATAELLLGVPVSSRGRYSASAGPCRRPAVPLGELLTPTGALILDAYVEEYGRSVDMRATGIGTGLGLRELADRPNAARLTLGQAAVTSSDALTDRVAVIETAIDDASGERIAVAISVLLRQGALDAYATSVMMKKGRPGFVITVLARPDCQQQLAASLLRETGSLGCRLRFSDRVVAAREVVSTMTPWGTVPVKIGRLGHEIISVAPESDACKSVAMDGGVSWNQVYRVAQANARRELSGEIK